MADAALADLGVFETIFPFTWEMVHSDRGWAHPDGVSYAAFDTPAGRLLVRFDTFPGEDYELPVGTRLTRLLFERSYRDRPTPAEELDAYLGWRMASRVLGTIARIVTDYLLYADVDGVLFGAADATRARVYLKLVRRLLRPDDVLVMMPGELRGDRRELLVLRNWKGRPLPPGAHPARMPRRRKRRRHG